MPKRTVPSTARRFPPGKYVVTRDPSTLLGPTDIGRWTVEISDCPGGVGIIGNIMTLDKHGAEQSWREPPAKWRRTKPSGRGFVDRQGEEYLEWLSSSPYVTVAPYVAPKPMTKAEVSKCIAANPKACYRDLSAALEARLRNATPSMVKWAEAEVAKARPGCGVDCDDRCPASGRCEA